MRGDLSGDLVCQAAREALDAAGFALLDREWGDVTSEKLGTVSALYHMQWGWESAPGEHWNDFSFDSLTGTLPTPLSCCFAGEHWEGGLSSLTGQMAAWIDQYLEPTEVTVRDICDDVRPVGMHNPAGGMASSAAKPGSES